MNNHSSHTKRLSCLVCLSIEFNLAWNYQIVISLVLKLGCVWKENAMSQIGSRLPLFKQNDKQPQDMSNNGLDDPDDPDDPDDQDDPDDPDDLDDPDDPDL